MSFVCVKKIQKFIKQIEMNHVCVNPIQLFIRQTTWSILGNPFTLFFFFFLFFLTTCLSLSLSLSLFERERERGRQSMWFLFYLFYFLDKQRFPNLFHYLTIPSDLCSPPVPHALGYYGEKSHGGGSKMLARDFESKISWDLKNH